VSAADAYFRVFYALLGARARGLETVTAAWVARVAGLPHRTALAALEFFEGAGFLTRLTRSTFALPRIHVEYRSLCHVFYEPRDIIALL